MANRTHITGGSTSGTRDLETRSEGRRGSETRTRGRNKMSTERFFRLSGLAVVVGGGVSIACELIDAFYNGNTTAYAAQTIYITSEFVFAAATILLLLGLPGTYASRAQGFGVTGLFGMALLFIAGAMLGVFANLEDAMVTPWLAAQAPSLADGFGPPPFFAFYNVQELAS